MATSSPEPIMRRADREVTLLVASTSLSVTRGRCPAGERVASPHVHVGHTDAFYVLEGELEFELGPDLETVTVGTGGFVAVPPGVAHAFRTAGGGQGRWLTIHAPDGGFADFMRGNRDGAETEWDIAPVPAHGGLPQDVAMVSA
jgi:quercetin dioxygenase-like cupin family protein